ncbi:MAG: ABC transporter substrate-binding protein [Acidimicrobiales bacterium]
MARPISTRSSRLIALFVVLALAVAACSDSDTDTTDTTGGADTTVADSEATTAGSGDTTASSDSTGESGGGLTGDAACQANKDAGTITYVSGFDYAASPAILDISVAEAKGYFDELCLDVDVQPNFAPANAALVIAGKAQFGSGDSFAELVRTNVTGDGDLVAIAQYGKTAVQALLVPADGKVKELSDLPGTTMGIKGDLPYSLQGMLAVNGIERSSINEILLDGFDPVAHLALGIDSLPVYKSNEPITLEREGIEFRLFDPLDYDVPASFGILFTSRSFYDEHPQAVRDFLRASYKGYADAVADPDEAVGIVIEKINAAGNPNFLFTETEKPRFTVESGLVAQSTPAGEGPGLIDPDKLSQEIDLLTDLKVFESKPDWESMMDADLGRELYDGTTVIWPGR